MGFTPEDIAEVIKQGRGLAKNQLASASKGEPTAVDEGDSGKERD
jgi:hypothetical protein